MLAAVEDSHTPNEEKPEADRPRIMFGYLWSFHDIGGIAITTGLLNLLYKHFPGYRMTSVGGVSEAQAYLLEKFPACEAYGDKIFKGKAYHDALAQAKNDFDGKLPALSQETMDYALNTFTQNFIDSLQRNNPEFLQALTESKLLIYPSGMMLNYGELTLSGMDFWGDTLPYSLLLLAARKLGVPYGLYGQSFTAFEGLHAVYFFKTLLEDAAFVSCRDGDTVDYVKSLGIHPRGLKFVPDSTVSFGLRDDRWGEAFMARHGLKPKEFMVVIPRTWPRESIITQFIGEERSKRHVHRLRTIITHWVRKTGMKVLIAVEVKPQMPYHRTVLFDSLPEEIKPHCVVLDKFWLPEQATSIFHNARILVNMDFHSFFLAIPEGTPTVALMTRESGRKIWAFRDFLLPEYMFDIDTTATSTIEDAIDYIDEHYEQESDRIQNKVIPHLRAIEEEQMKEIAAVLERERSS